MKRIVFGALALAAAAIGTVPAMAQGVSVDVPGFHAGVGVPYGPDSDWRYRHRRAYDSYNYYGGGCRDVTIQRRGWNGDLITRTERRCD